MRIYTLNTLDSTGYVIPVDDSITARFFREFQFGNTFASYEIGPYEAEWFNRPSSYQPDIIHYKAGSQRLFSTRAKQVLEKQFLNTGEWLEVSIGDEVLWMFNCFEIVDAIDESKSEIRRLASNRVTEIRIHAFIESKVPEDRVFMVATRPYYMFCTDTFVDFVKDYGWEGFYFKPVWDSEHEPFPSGPFRREIRLRPEIYGPDGFVRGFESSWPDEWKEKAKRDKERYE